MGQAQAGAPALFGASHPAAVGFVIHAQQVQDAVEHQDPDFLLGLVAEFAGLGAGARKRDGDIAKQAFTGKAGREAYPTGEREHVRGVILAAEIAVQTAQFGVARDQAIESPPLGHFRWSFRANRSIGPRRKPAGARRNVTILPSGEDMSSLRLAGPSQWRGRPDRKSTRLNSSH